MKKATIKNITTNKTVSCDAKLASDFFSRLIGWLGHIPQEEEAIVIPKCSSIHTCFMKVAIDVIFLSASGQVIKTVTISPWHISRAKEAECVIELPAGTIERKKCASIGNIIRYEENI